MAGITQSKQKFSLWSLEEEKINQIITKGRVINMKKVVVLSIIIPMKQDVIKIMIIIIIIM